MGFQFIFRGMENGSDLSLLVDFLRKQNLRYSRYDDWVDRTRKEIDEGYKKVIFAFSERRLVGDLIYQQHKKNNLFLELKNLRVHPLLRDRHFARFMLRQAEAEAKNYEAIICDAPSEFPEIISFMESCGYFPILQKPLYDNNKLEVVMMKTIRKRKELILPFALKIFDKV